MMDFRNEWYPGPEASFLRRRLFLVIFGSETRLGRIFDVTLIVCILLSVLAVMIDSVHEYHLAYGGLLYGIEWAFTILFTVEYACRIYCVRKPIRYARSFFGVIDILAILPTYLSLFVVGTQYLLVIRLLRVLRIFRILKIVPYIGESNILMTALWNARRKIFVFLFAVATIAVVLGSFMYVIEGEEHGFTSIPISIYWSVVTMTTVGYGDLVPATPAGKALASFIMVLGYSIIAIPTGIVSVEIANAIRSGQTIEVCPRCGHLGHDAEALYCSRCGAELDQKGGVGERESEPPT